MFTTADVGGNPGGYRHRLRQHHGRGEIGGGVALGDLVVQLEEID
jgi:hypothetical protein